MLAPLQLNGVCNVAMGFSAYFVDVYKLNYTSGTAVLNIMKVE